MGRHSKPDPEDPVDEPSDEHRPDDGGEATGPQAIDASGGVSNSPPEFPPRDDALAHYGGGNPDEQADQADVPAGAEAYADRADEDHADEDFSPGGDHHPDEDEYPAGEDRYRADGVFGAGTPDEYPEFAPRPADPDASGPPSPAPSLFPAGFRAGHRGLGDWRGGHRSEGGRRGVSVGVIVALVAVIVVVGTVILWSFFGDALSNRSHRAAVRCVGGKEDVAVIVDPSIADPVQRFAESYNSSAGPVGDHCMVVGVRAAGSDAVIGGFIGEWPAELGDRPALWIPGSSVSTARLTAATGQKTISDSRSLVTSPVLLAVRPELERALNNQNWAALPGLQTNPNALGDLNLPGWGSLRLALPMHGNGDAPYLAGEAVAAASTPAGAPPTQGIGAVRTMLRAQPKLTDNSLVEAMNTLLNPGDVAAAPVHAVITTEQQVFQRGQSLPEAKRTLGAWLPSGAVPVADYPTVLLGGSWLSQEQVAAASEFAHFMRKPEQLEKLASAGFRVNGVQPPSSPVTSFPALPAALSVGDDGLRVTLADAMATSSNRLAATIMLDQSMPTDEGGKTQLANVIAVLEGTIKSLPPSDELGLWTFDGHEGRVEVKGGPLSDPVNGQPRTAVLLAALDRQYSTAGGAVSFTTLRLIYQDMQANYRAGQTNSILVITAGPHTDQTLDGAGLQNFIRTSADPAKPIAVNVIDFGADPDRATWEAVARLSGGGYQNLATSASPDLAAAVNTFLS